MRRGGRAAAGVVAHTVTLLVSDHPVCGAKVGYAEIFLMPQPPLLTRRGFTYDQGRLNPIMLENPMVFLSVILTVPRTVPP